MPLVAIPYSRRFGPTSPVLGLAPLDHLADIVELDQRLPAEEIDENGLITILGKHRIADFLAHEVGRQGPARLMPLVAIDAIEIARLGHQKLELPD